MRVPFAAYRGGDPFVFVCYSHDDADVVYAELVALRSAGIDLWFDEGIAPGSEWSENLAQRIVDCSVFLYFASPQSAASAYCRREINFALDQGRPVLAVHLEPVDLPAGLKLSLGNRQAILRYRYAEAEYRATIEGTLRDALGQLPPVAAAVAAPAQISDPTTSTGRGTRQTVAIAVLGLLALGAVGTWWVMSDARPPTLADAAPAADFAAPPFEMPTALPVLVRRPEDAASEPRFAERLHDDLTVQAAKNRGLKVVRDSGAADDSFYVLASRIEHQADRHRITVRLEAPDGAVIWLHTFDQPPGAERFLAAETVGQLAGLSWMHFRLEVAPNPIDARARREVLLGTVGYQSAVLGVGGNMQVVRLVAADHARRAIRFEPDFLGAHLLLVSGVVANRAEQRGLLTEFLPEAHEAGRALLQVQARRPVPALSGEWAIALGNLLLRLDLDYDMAERLYEIARSEGRSEGQLGWELGCIYAAQGDQQLAIRQFETALAAGAGSNHPWTHLSLGLARLASGQYRRAVEHLEHTRTLALPGSDVRGMADVLLIKARFRAGQQEAAARLLDEAWAASGDAEPQLFPGVLALLGRDDLAREVLDGMAARYPESRPVWYWEAVEGHYHLGDLDAAFLWLDRVIDNREWALLGHLRRDPTLEPLRADPRYAEAMARLTAIEQAGSPLRADLAAFLE